jgi:hypothetical protein
MVVELHTNKTADLSQGSQTGLDGQFVATPIAVNSRGGGLRSAVSRAGRSVRRLAERDPVDLDRPFGVQFDQPGEAAVAFAFP